MAKYTKTLLITIFLAGAFVFCTEQALAAQYTVKPGDSIFLISTKFGTTVDTIIKSNNLASCTIYPGQVLNVPSGVSVSGHMKYVVKSGDTLYIISRRFNTSVNNLMQMNGLKSATIYPGQALNVPAAGFSYTVKSGDTLYILSQKFGVSVQSIRSANNLTSDWLWPGQVLQIKNVPSSTRSQNTVSRGGSSSRSEVMLLARLINGESRGEPYEGQVAVGAVVLNRVRSPLFPNTLSGVIYQSNEFSVVLDGQINLTPSTTSIKAAENALNGWDPSNGALYYWNPVKAPNNKFLNSKKIIARIGNHVFAK